MSVTRTTADAATLQLVLPRRKQTRTAASTHGISVTEDKTCNLPANVSYFSKKEMLVYFTRGDLAGNMTEVALELIPLAQERLYVIRASTQKTAHTKIDQRCVANLAAMIATSVVVYKTDGPITFTTREREEIDRLASDVLAAKVLEDTCKTKRVRNQPSPDVPPPNPKLLDKKKRK